MKHIKLFEDFGEHVPSEEVYIEIFNEKLEKAKDELEGFLQLFQDLECNCSIRIYSEDKYGKDYKSFDDISAEDFINHVRRTSRSYKLNDVSIMLIVSKATINHKEIFLLKDTIKSVKSMLEFTDFSIEDLSSTEYISEKRRIKRRIKRFILDICFYSKEKSIKENVSISKHLMDNLNKEQLDFIDRFVSRKANYVLNSDKSIDIEGNVYIFSSTSLPIKIPIKFGKVNGNFICNDCGLKSLENMPDYVSGDFECNQNHLINLIGSPSDVGGNFKCFKNKLESIEGMPLEIGGNFVCCDNNIKEIDSVSNIEGALICDKNVDLKKFAGYYKSLHKI